MALPGNPAELVGFATWGGQLAVGTPLMGVLWPAALLKCGISS